MSIHENTKYQYIRLNDGKEIFAMVTDLGFEIEMYLPMNLMCKPSTIGSGVTVHLGPLVPFTNDEFVIVDHKDIVYRTSISKQFIDLYDDAVTTWIELRDSGRMQVRSHKQEHEEQTELVKNIIHEKLQNTSEKDIIH